MTDLPAPTSGTSFRRWRGAGVDGVDLHPAGLAGRGLAQALLAERMRMFGDMGMDEVAVGVHTTDPTGAFARYEGRGYQVVSRSYEYRKEVPS